jgi:DNA polymerase-3 subunit gamma/tau
MPGGIDTDAIRRSWPDILAKIFTIRRTTWTFLSEHTQVLDYDGTRLLLGIQTEGLANTFRRGHHAELVRQALSEVLGVEAIVEGIPAAQSGRSVSPTAGAARLSDAPSPASPPPASPPPAAPPAAASSRVAGAPPSATSPPVRPATSLSASATPASATSPAAGRSAAAPERPSTPMQRARAAVAREANTRNTSASSSAADDSMVSADDEDIEEAVAVGQPVIARVLGGTVIGELDQ